LDKTLASGAGDPGLPLNLLQVLQAVVVLDSAETQNSFSLLVAARVFTILHFNQGSFGNRVEKAPSLFSVKIACMVDR